MATRRYTSKQILKIKFNYLTPKEEIELDASIL
jgi:hypothetical protein